MRRRMSQLYIKKQKNDEIIFSLAWNMFTVTKKFLFWIFWREKMWCFCVKKVMKIRHLLITEKFLFWSFREWEIRPFLSQKVDGKMLFTDYYKVLVLNFSVIGKTVFFWVKKLMERWYLLTNEKFLFWTL